jgi:predicted dehydrogenase
MSGQEIGLFMIGCGGFARRYHVPVIEEDKGVRLLGICDPVPADATRAFASRHGAPVVDRIEALPGAQGRTAAIVTTPHTLHAGHVKATLERGWHTLCDKPFVMHVEEAQSLAEEARARGLVGGVAYNRRFDRGCIRAREIIRTGGIGRPAFVQTVQLGYEQGGWFLDPALGGGGPYTGRASHMADFVPWLIDTRPTAVRSRLRGGSATRTDRGGFIELLLDGLECQMTCVEEGWHGWDEIRVFGETGLLELRRPQDYQIGWDLRWWSGRGEVQEHVEADQAPGDATRNFLGAVRGEAEVGCSFAEAVMAVAIVEEAFASARDGCGWRKLG